MLSYGFLILSIKCLNLSVGENILTQRTLPRRAQFCSSTLNKQHLISIYAGEHNLKLSIQAEPGDLF